MIISVLELWWLDGVCNASWLVVGWVAPVQGGIQAMTLRARCSGRVPAGHRPGGADQGGRPEHTECGPTDSFRPEKHSMRLCLCWSTAWVRRSTPSTMTAPAVRSVRRRRERRRVDLPLPVRPTTPARSPPSTRGAAHPWGIRSERRTAREWRGTRGGTREGDRKIRRMIRNLVSGLSEGGTLTLTLPKPQPQP